MARSKGNLGSSTNKQRSFAQVPTANINRSSFDRTSTHKTTFDAGYLIPFFLDEALPGDTFNLKTHGFCRMSTPIFPVMDNLFLDTHFFSVPMRLVWDNWEKMMGAQDDPGDSTDYMIPQTVVNGPYLSGSLADHMGIPVGTDIKSHSALWARAYYTIWNEWFRDENLQNSNPVDTGDGPDPQINYTFIARRGKRHDYFTSALPWPQKGPDVTLPLGIAAPVVADTSSSTSNIPNWSNNNTLELANFVLENGEANTVNWNGTPSATQPDFLGFGNATGLETDLSNATAATINQIREAFQVQKLYERDARGGTRYTEIIKSHFNVTSPDMRLQRPEYLGGGTTPVNISPIYASADTLTDVQTGRELGGLSAVGTASFNNHGFTKSFTEHEMIIGLVSVRADLTYQQGLNRMWSRETRFDFYWPVFQGLGEQIILNQEIYTQGLDVDEQVFGYQERYAEYRYKPSLITGALRSTETNGTPLDAWHLAQNFTELPTLGNAFIVEDPPMDRVLANTTEAQFIADFYHQLRCARPMPMYGIPGNIDRF